MIARRRLAIASATFAILGALASPVHAEDSVTVAATVSMVGPCLTTSATTLDFGPQTFSLDNQDEQYSIRGLTYTSCSAGPELVFGRTTEAVSEDGTITWSPAAGRQQCPTPGPNRFVIEVTGTGDGRSFFNAVLTETDRELESVGPGAVGSVDDVWLILPCVGSGGAGHTMSFDIIFTATF